MFILHVPYFYLFFSILKSANTSLSLILKLIPFVALSQSLVTTVMRNHLEKSSSSSSDSRSRFSNSI